MTIPAPFSIPIYQGDSYDLLIRVKIRNTSGDIVYQDLTGATAKAQIRSSALSPTIDAEFLCTLTDQVTLTGGVLLHLTSTQTAAMTNSTGVWDCEVQYPNGDRKTFLAGQVTITREVTRV